MTEFAARISLSTLPAFCRRLMVVVISFWFPLSATANIAETSSIEAALQLIETFDVVCSEQVEGSKVADKSGLITLTSDQVAGLATALGYRRAPDAIWSEEDAGWYQVQVSMDSPETCLFVSFDITLRDMKSAWNTRFADDAQWQSFSDAAIQQSDIGQSGNRILSGAYVFRPHEGQIIMAAVAGMQFKETGVVMLRYQKTKSSAKACEHSPEECR